MIWIDEAAPVTERAWSQLTTKQQEKRMKTALENAMEIEKIFVTRSYNGDYTYKSDKGTFLRRSKGRLYWFAAVHTTIANSGRSVETDPARMLSFHKNRAGCRPAGHGDEVVKVIEIAVGEGA